MPSAPRLIEVALPLDAINKASAREKSIRHGHPSTLHLWWARRPLAAARAVLFTSLVPDPDPDNPAVPRPFVEACLRLPLGDYSKVKDTPRNRLFDFIATLVTWEATTDEQVISQARELISLGCEGEPPPVLDPFAGGGSIPLEAQRLGLSAHASDLNPVAVLINKAMIEIPPMFAGQRAGQSTGSQAWHGRGCPLEGRGRARRRRALLWRVDARASAGAHRPFVSATQGRDGHRLAVGAHRAIAQPGRARRSAAGQFLRAQQEEGPRVPGGAHYRDAGRR